MPEASGSSAGSSILSLIVSFWWVFLLFGGAILEWVAETFDVGVAALRRRAKAKRRHQLKMKQLELQIAQAKADSLPGVPRPLPGQCVHRRVVQVRDRSDDLVGWLCKGCDEQLPADWAVAAEDLP
jgi:hypothetical protein